MAFAKPAWPNGEKQVSLVPLLVIQLAIISRAAVVRCHCIRLPSLERLRAAVQVGIVAAVQVVAAAAAVAGELGWTTQ